MFRDRIDAGEQLALQLEVYRDRADTLVIGLPRGGVPVAYEVARSLNLPLDIVSPRKIGAPMNKEFAIGAITEGGQGILDQDVIGKLGISKHYVESEVEKEKKVAKNRLDSYRQGMPPRAVKGKTVILVDDGLATGSTMKAAIKTMKAEGAESIVVAVPVSPPDTLLEIEQEVDEVICLSAPHFFHAVGQFYEDFTPTEDEEVVELLRLARTHPKK